MKGGGGGQGIILTPQKKLPSKCPALIGLKNAFFPLKINKSPGYDEISFSVLKKCFSSLREPLKYMFNLPIEFFQMT